MNFEIPCAVVARLANVIRSLKYDASEWCNSIRIEDGLAIASNRQILACEQIGGPSGIFHLINDPALVAQCAKEAVFDSVLYISVIDGINIATCKTTLGYVHPGNCAAFSSKPNELDRWRSVIPTAPAKKSKGGMVWATDNMVNLIASSPSGHIVFEEQIDTSRPTIIRDAFDPNWFGMFIPDLSGHPYASATVPEWVKP